MHWNDLLLGDLSLQMNVDFCLRMLLACICGAANPSDRISFNCHSSTPLIHRDAQNPKRSRIRSNSELISLTTTTSTTTSPAMLVISAWSSLPERESRIFSTATRIPTAAILKIRSTSMFPLQ